MAFLHSLAGAFIFKEDMAEVAAAATTEQLDSASAGFKLLEICLKAERSRVAP